MPRFKMTKNTFRGGRRCPRRRMPVNMVVFGDEKYGKGSSRAIIVKSFAR